VTEPADPKNQWAPLDALVGEWTVELHGHGDVPAGRVTFEPALDGHYLVQRSDVPDPYPDSMAVISFDAETGGYRQHYFDARGVTRVYRMDLRGGVWELLRDEADFSPLDFAQRFIGRFSPDGRTIRGRWDARGEDGAWERDFDVVFTRRA